MNNLAILRKRRNISQEVLAGVVGTDQSHISRIENSGVEPGATLALAIARALDSTVEELFGHLADDDNQQPQEVSHV